VTPHVSRALPPPCPCSACSALAEAIDLDTRARRLVRDIAIKVDRSHGLLTNPPHRRRPVGKDWRVADDDDA
jgi:hypothetical protein